MTGIDGLLRAGGLVLLAAGVLVVPLPFISGWIGAPNIARPSWWAVHHAATLHHFLLPFGLFALFAVQRAAAGAFGEAGGRGGAGALSEAGGRRGAGGRGAAGVLVVVAFVLAVLGNALVGGIGLVQITVLPALAAHPEGQGALDCTPFYVPATQSAAGFLEAACADWRFEALAAWTGIAWFTLLAGTLLLGAAIIAARVLPRFAGALIALGPLVMLAGVLAGRPESIGAYGLAVAGLGYAWCGLRIARSS